MTKGGVFRQPIHVSKQSTYTLDQSPVSISWPCAPKGLPESWREQIFQHQRKTWSKLKWTVSVLNICLPPANSRVPPGPVWRLCAVKSSYQLPANLRLPSVEKPEHTSVPGSTHSDPWSEASEKWKHCVWLEEVENSVIPTRLLPPEDNPRC